jgi:quinol monooxygenase YgiN
MAQTSLFVKLTTQPGKRDEAIAALERMLPTVHEEEGTLVYSFHLDAGNADVIWVFELYTDGDALGVHAGSPAMAELVGSFGDLLAAPAEMIMATPTAAGKGLPS